MAFTTSFLQEATGGSWLRHADATILGAEIDTRRSVVGRAFFAMRGTRSDGHAHVAAAIEGGCAALVVEEPVDVDGDVAIIAVDDTRRALMDAARAARSTFASSLVITITGSVGKTTTKDLLAAALVAALGLDRVAAAPGSFNNDLGVPLTLLNRGAADVVICELGINAPGEMGPLVELARPQIGVLTALGDAHLDGLGDISQVRREKGLMLEALAADGVAVVAGDLDLAGLKIIAPVCREHGDNRVDGLGQALLCGQPLALLGVHNAQNAALALAAAKSACALLGVATCEATLVEAIAAAPPAAGRMEVLERGDITFVHDAYNANPASMRAALAAFAAMDAPGRRVAVLGDMLELGDAQDAAHASLAGELAALNLDLLVAVGPAMRVLEAAGATWCPDSLHASAHLRGGDLVLLKGSRGMALERILDATSAEAST